MPQRPSKKVKVQPGSKSQIEKGLVGGDKDSQQKHREKQAKMILGKFQGRKSI